MPAFPLLDRLAAWVSSGAVGLAAALVTLGLLVLTLPAKDRSKLRLPAIMLAFYVALAVPRVFLPGDSPTSRTLGIFALFFLLSSLARAAFMLLVDVFIGLRLARPLPKIIHDILQALAFVVVVIITLRAAGVEPGSLLTTSALLTAVVGLSLQETLGNLVSGLSIQVQRPFEVGDWIQMDPDPRNIGRVLEINWRATKVLTNEQIEVIIPNGALAKVSIRNFTQPSTTSRRTVEVQAAYDAPPRKVEEGLLDAIEAVPGVLGTPEPFVMLLKFGDSGVTYQLCYFIDEFSRRERIDSAVRERIWYAFRRRGLAIPFPVQSVQLHDVATKQKEVAETERAARLRSMRQVDFLATLPAPLLERFATLSRTYLYAPGEVVFRQGESGSELFIVKSGEVAVLVGREGVSTAEIGRLKRDACFGELAVMTGEARSATVVATVDTVLVAIDRDTVHDLIADAPKVAEKLTEVLVARQALLEENLSQRQARAEEDTDRKSSALMKKLRDFFAN